VNWMREARCRWHDPEVFFAQHPADERTAVEVCRGCPVRLKCLSYALAHGLEFGVWGGLTEQQRRRLLRDRVAS
jgi:WhiB family transcriptional regulator, redox-sensing transcriptional regulator